MNAPLHIKCDEEALRDLLRERDETAAKLAAIDQRIAEERRAWCASKGLSFIRIEHLRRELAA